MRLIVVSLSTSYLNRWWYKIQIKSTFFSDSWKYYIPYLLLFLHLRSKCSVSCSSPCQNKEPAFWLFWVSTSCMGNKDSFSRVTTEFLMCELSLHVITWKAIFTNIIDLLIHKLASKKYQFTNDLSWQTIILDRYYYYVLLWKSGKNPWTFFIQSIDFISTYLCARGLSPCDEWCVSVCSPEAYGRGENIS